MMNCIKRYLAPLIFLAVLIWNRYLVSSIVFRGMLVSLVLMIVIYVTSGTVDGPGPPPWP
jgi:uncharacterized membrane protein